MTHNNCKKFCHPPFLRNDTHIWFSFHMSRYYFSFYKNVDFLGCYGDKRAKNGPKWQKIMFIVLYTRKPNIWSSVVVLKFKMIISLEEFLFFFKILVFWVNRKGKGKKWQKTLSALLCIPGTIYHMIFIYGTRVKR